jgi:hypothetical protein
MAWIGIDIDAGSQEKYEQIRRSLTKTSVVVNNVELWEEILLWMVEDV